MYQKREIGELGNLEFLGCWGALAEFEEAIDKGYTECFKEGVVPRLNHVFMFVYQCHRVAQMNQKKPIDFDFETFKINCDNSVIDLYSILINDALKIEKEKKIAKQVKAKT
jgi:hypothetical protein